MKEFLFEDCSPRWKNVTSLILRVIAGVIFFAHGYQKMFEGSGVTGVGGFFDSLGIPAPIFFAWVVTLVELVGGAFLILGFLTKISGTLLSIDMLVATLLVHADNGIFVSDGGYEFTLILFAVAASLTMTGPGKLAIDNILFKKREIDTVGMSGEAEQI
ncbi:MAG: DoxX family protein [Parcubacteria group bacterium CG11_big_fil_rev_8_21_14_0_20_39_22]|nr:MAG: DoxX family protein [Parcubacteria group bacterium CG11_big_fil_rev_8_21_14_0_20_39_22]